jgi:hypothetical protein
MQSLLKSMWNQRQSLDRKANHRIKSDQGIGVVREAKMYRRIQLINHIRQKDGSVDHLISGICFTIQTSEVAESWIDLNTPRRRLNKNLRFYFTEAGWEKYGRAIVAACQRSGQGYRVLRTKERSVDVFYKDEWQVAVRVRKRRA